MAKTTTKYLVRIAPLSLARTLGGIGLAIGLIYSVILFLLLGEFAYIGFALAGLFSKGSFFLFALFTMLIYGCSGFFCGLLFAFLFNLFNGKGIKLEFKDSEESEPSKNAASLEEFRIGHEHQVE